MLAIVASMGGFIFGYDTGQISDMLLMDDFLLRFAQCGTPGDVSTCHFSNVRSGLIVGLLSIGTLVGALLGAPSVSHLLSSPHLVLKTHFLEPLTSLVVATPWSQNAAFSSSVSSSRS